MDTIQHTEKKNELSSLSLLELTQMLTSAIKKEQYELANLLQQEIDTRGFHG